MWLSEEGIAFATNRTLRKLGVNITPSAVYTYDGNQEGKVTFTQGGVTAVRVGEAVDPNSIQKVIGVLDGQEMEILADAITLSESGGITFLNADGASFVCIVTGDNDIGASPGTYATQNEWYYVSRIEVTETTTPIDPKYLPGVCLPVVELTTAPTEQGAQMSAEESAKLDEALALGLPIAVKGTMPDGTYASGVYSFGYSQGVPVFASVAPGFTIAMMKHPGYGWIAIMNNQ